jgi:hypothetical protein
VPISKHNKTTVAKLATWCFVGVFTYTLAVLDGFYNNLDIHSLFSSNPIVVHFAGDAPNSQIVILLLED